METRDYLHFALAEEIYAIEAKDVDEIIQSPNMTMVPTAPEYIEGVFHYRGAILPSVDLKKVLNITHESDSGKSRYLIIRPKDITIALKVDKVLGVFTMNTSDLEAPVPTPSVEAGFVRAQARLNERIVLILDGNNLIEGTKLKKG